MHHLRGALPFPNVPARVTRGALVAHSHSFAPPRCRTSHTQYNIILFRITSVPLLVPLWNDLGCLVFDGVGLV